MSASFICSRRMMLGGAAAFGLAGCVPIDTSPAGRLAARLRILEAASGGTLGVAFLDTGSGEMIGHNRTMRFGHASSFKLSLAALVLARGAAGTLDIERRVRWTEADLLSYAPYTRERVAEGASLRELAQATQVTSDNTAANLLLRELGGPQAITAFWRLMGDQVSRLDRIEPALNFVPVTEYRDTTTPEAMARNVASLLYGDVLPEAERTVLRQWLIDTQTGLNRVRAGIRTDIGWVVGDKTGTAFAGGMGSLYVDIGFVEPPPSKQGRRAPITFAAYYRLNEVHEKTQPAAEAVLAQVGRVLADFATG